MRASTAAMLTGGIALIVCGAIHVVAALSPGMTAGGPIARVAADAVWAVALLVFAVGLGRGGERGRLRPSAVATLCVVGLWPLAAGLVDLALAPDGAIVPDAGWVVWGYARHIVPLVAALVAAAGIARSAVAPSPWNRAPLVALGVQVVAMLLPVLLSLVVGPDGIQRLTGTIAALGMVGALVPTMGLGVVAVAVAARSAPPLVE